MPLNKINIKQIDGLQQQLNKSLTNVLNVGNTASQNILMGTYSIGLGTISPSTNLHVEGGFRYVDGNQTANYILTSDANGLASWTASSNISAQNISNTDLTITTTGARKLILAGALSTDYFTVRNSSDTSDILKVQGNEQVFCTNTNFATSLQASNSLDYVKLGNASYVIDAQRTVVSGNLIFRLKNGTDGGDYNLTAQGSGILTVSNGASPLWALRKDNLSLFSASANTTGAGAKVLIFKNGTAPTTTPVDTHLYYSSDQASGNACPHFRTEAGDVVKLYKEPGVTTAQGIADALFNQGLLASSTISTVSVLNDLQDVDYLTGSESNNDILQYNSNSGAWLLTNTPTFTSINVETVTWTIDLVEAQTYDIYAPYDFSMATYSQIYGATATYTFTDDGAAYSIGATVSQGSKFTVTSNMASVVNLSVNK